MITYGAEIEKPISDIDTGESHGISQDFFNAVGRKFPDSKLKYSDVKPQIIIAVETRDLGVVGLDNAFNLQETSTRVTGDLNELGVVLQEDLSTVQGVLAAEGATVINLSLHPLVDTKDDSNYQAFVAPKGVYDYIRVRGWNHKAGIDAKAHNSPCTGIEPHQAAKAITTIVGAGAAIIGLFGNSPFAEGKPSGFKETRCTIWERMMGNSSSAGDLKTARFPDKPFTSLKDYFEWMFGPGTNIHFVMVEGGNYKTFGDGAIIIEGNPSVLDYLTLYQAKGHFFNNGKEVIVTPHLSHLEAMQFAQFIGARVRWQFNYKQIDRVAFLQAMRENRLEDLFSNGGVNYVYIEGRDAGANFPDAFLTEVDPDVAVSTFLAPSAIQAGLLTNLDESYRLVMAYPWQQLKELRQTAIKDGLQGEVNGLRVANFAAKIIDIAARGLDTQGQKMLDYPKYVLEIGQNGADRALADYEKGKKLPEIVKSRNVVI